MVNQMRYRVFLKKIIIIVLLLLIINILYRAFRDTPVTYEAKLILK